MPPPNIARRALPKMHGAENTFWIADERRGAFGAEYPELMRRLGADPATAADGILVLSSAEHAAARMRIVNADGSEAQMCGNGMRCAARYLAEDGSGDRFVVVTAAGPIACEILDRRDDWAIAIDLGMPEASRGVEEQVLALDGVPIRYTFVSLGNPHAVVFVDDVEAIEIASFGRAFNRHAHFPDGVNVHVAQVVGPDALRVRHWERELARRAPAARERSRARSPRSGAAGCGPRRPSTFPEGGCAGSVWQSGSSARLIGPAAHLGSREIALP